MINLKDDRDRELADFFSDNPVIRGTLSYPDLTPTTQWAIFRVEGGNSNISAKCSQVFTKLSAYFGLGLLN